MKLERTRGTIRVDLGAVRIDAEDQRDHTNYSATAANWLNVGASIPPAERERRRWASFEIAELLELSSEAAHEARQQKHSKANADPDAAPATEVRTVTAIARGDLVLNDRRMSQDFRISIALHYPAEATPGFPPDRIVVSTRSDQRIVLDAYGIKPRNPAGVVVAKDLALLGSTVGTIAQASFSLTFVHQSKRKP
jgi:hypothetical protein